MSFVLPSKSLATNYVYISKLDPAVDTEDKDFDKKWKQYLDGAIDKPPLKPGEEPVGWEMKHLSPREKARVADVDSREGFHAALITAAAIALQEAHGLTDDQGDPVEVTKSRDGKIVHASEEFIEKLPAKLWYELGLEVNRRLQLSPLS